MTLCQEDLCLSVFCRVFFAPQMVKIFKIIGAVLSFCCLPLCQCFILIDRDWTSVHRWCFCVSSTSCMESSSILCMSAG